MSALRSQCRVFAEPIPSTALRVSVEIGEDVLELAISRRDMSPALDRQIRNGVLADPDYNPDEDQDEESMPLWKVEAIAKRAASAVHGYRIYPKGSPEATVKAIEWRYGLKPEDLLDMGQFLWPILNAIWEKLMGPNPKAGDAAAS